MYRIVDINQADIVKIIKSNSETQSYPVFEYSVNYVFGSLGIDRKLSILKESDQPRAIVFKDGVGTGLFSPTEITEGVLDFIKNKFPDFYLIRNFLDSTPGVGLLETQGWSIRKRSEEEAVYDINIVTSLEGKRFKNARRNKKRLLDPGELIFREIKASNFDDLNIVIESWRQTQAKKYSEDRTYKDISLLKSFLEHSAPSIGYIAYLKNTPVGYSLIEIVEKGAVILTIKGLNHEPGVNGITDAIYINNFEALQKMGIKYANDGSLGTESGTRNHKLNFAPIYYVDTYEAVRN